MGIKPERRAQHDLHELMEVQHESRDMSSLSNRWKLTNKKEVLLVGPAGIGKSHLLAKISCNTIFTNVGLSCSF